MKKALEVSFDEQTCRETLSKILSVNLPAILGPAMEPEPPIIELVSPEQCFSLLKRTGKKGHTESVTEQKLRRPTLARTQRAEQYWR